MPEYGPEMSAVLDGLRDMPSLPVVMAKLVGIIARPETSASDIAGVLSRDPGLVTRILKQVNSSYYGFPRRIATITSAVVILGFRQILNIAMSSLVFNNFVAGARAGLDINGLWLHSLGAAFLSSAIARRVAPRNAEDAFICGLLHDLGKFVMFRNDADNAVRVNELAVRDGILSLEAERRLLPYDHAGLGAAALERWNLPPAIVDIVRFHHDPLAAPAEAVLPACVANFADLAARALLMGKCGDQGIGVLTAEVWARIGLDWPAVEEISRQVAEEYVKSGAFFGA
ncbi:MAG: HDOD domain-containing protein [Planctomycetota bacterium]|jgi:putative nucleotidyltransferase with HDIG domain|nr:HDOD domain-containing protein [Planctomycetota bacterium]